VPKLLSTRKKIPLPSRTANDDAMFRRNETIHAIIHDIFRAQGVSANEADKALSKRLSNKMLKFIGESCDHGTVFQRRVQLFATLTLLDTKCHKKPTPNQAKKFMADVMGATFVRTVTEGDAEAVATAGKALNELLRKPKWAAVHRGHVAMSCLSLLSAFDLSFHSFRWPQGLRD
jgi:hypothetical protein